MALCIFNNDVFHVLTDMTYRVHNISLDRVKKSRHVLVSNANYVDIILLIDSYSLYICYLFMVDISHFVTSNNNAARNGGGNGLRVYQQQTEQFR